MKGKGEREPKAQTAGASYPQQNVAITHLKWGKVPCLKKQRDWRGLNPWPPDPEFEVLTA